MQKIVDWMDKEHPDQILTHSCLANCIRQYIEDNSDSDCIIVPFSELAPDSTTIIQRRNLKLWLATSREYSLQLPALIIDSAFISR